MTCIECESKRAEARGLCRACYERARYRGQRGDYPTKGIPAAHLREEFSHFDPGREYSNRRRARAVAERIGATWLAVERAAYRGGWFA